ncbi:MAG TPA: hypothetical protein VIJ38_01620, partial [Acidobacteriaceae bacterium]
MTARKARARTGARFASEKQVPRCARNDRQKDKGNGKGKGNGNGNGNGDGKSSGQCGGPSLRSRMTAKTCNGYGGSWGWGGL